MARAKKKKRMTAKEIREKAEIKRRLQEEGILPPDKPRLDRKRFIEDTAQQFLSLRSWTMLPYLEWALQEVMEKRDSSGRYSLEAVGAAKVIRLAIEMANVEAERQRAGESSHMYEEHYERLKSIYDA